MRRFTRRFTHRFTRRTLYMEVNVKADVKALTKELNRIQKKQIPFATSKALNEVAFDVRKTLQTVLPDYIDAPTPYTIRGVQVEKSTKKKLVATVGFRGKGFGKGQGSVAPSDYMHYQTKGGTRTPRGTAIGVPTKHLRVNKYGNIARGKIKKFLANTTKYFSGTPKGIGGGAAGIWERMGRGGRGKIRMVVGWEPKADYRKRFPFEKVVKQSVNVNFRKRFESALRVALGTAR